MEKLLHAYTKQPIKNVFKYQGIYYPSIGNENVEFNGDTTETAWSKKLGGWSGFWSFLPMIGVKCLLKDINRPYKKVLIDMIESHEEMEISKWYLSEKNRDLGFMWIVKTKKGEYIGEIDEAINLLSLKNFGTQRGNNTSICYGYNEENNMSCGFVHNVMHCFKVGDKVFKENFGDENTPYNEHGRKTIKTYSDLMESAINYAKYAES